MGITHVIRGDDHLNNTPRQINMFEALGYGVPVFAHLPMIHGPDGAKLSKRHGAVDIREYREAGYLPEAMLNYLLRLGWSHGDQEIFTVEEMIALFDLEKVSRSAARFDADKLLWVNQQHIQQAQPTQLAPLLAEQLARKGIEPQDGPSFDMSVAALAPRSGTMVEMAERARPYYEEFEAFDAKAAKAHLRPVAEAALHAVRAELAAVSQWTQDSTEAVVEAVADSLDLKLGKVAQPLRVALTGQGASPGIGETLMLVGRDRALARIDRALAFISERAAAH